MKTDFFEIDPDFTNFGFTRHKLNTSKMAFMANANENAPLVSLDRGGKGSVSKEYFPCKPEMELLSSFYSSIRNTYIS